VVQKSTTGATSAPMGPPRQQRLQLTVWPA
jgi:hypothetical protein